jgi:hypothetical protein
MQNSTEKILKFKVLMISFIIIWQHEYNFSVLFSYGQQTINIENKTGFSFQISQKNSRFEI